jgi:hypothetical protein
MTLQSDHVHGAVIFPGYAGSGTISMVYRKEPRLTSLPTTAHQSSTAFRVIVVLQAIVFLFAATLHTGLFGVPALYPAMVVEGLCGIGCVISAFGQFTHQLWAPRASLIIQILILFGVLLGILAVATDASIRTPLNVGLHAVMLVLILLGLLVLAVPGISLGLVRSNRTP